MLSQAHPVLPPPLLGRGRLNNNRGMDEGGRLGMKSFLQPLWIWRSPAISNVRFRNASLAGHEGRSGADWKTSSMQVVKASLSVLRKLVHVRFCGGRGGCSVSMVMAM